MSLGQAAASYAAEGLHVLPLHQPAGAGGCSCPGGAACTSPAKHPRNSHGVREASADPATVARWWQRWPGANVGVATGRVSGVLVIDVDDRHGGRESLASLERRHGPLPGARVVTGGGLHIWTAAPERSIANSAGRLGPGIDVRGDGGYVVAPPSVHHSGALYRWEGAGPSSLEPAPDWLVRRLTAVSAEVPLSRVRRVPTPSERAGGIVEEQLALVAGAPEGTRNHTLNRAAFVLGRLAGERSVSPREMHGLLLDAARHAGLGELEAVRTIRSGLAAGLGVGRGAPIGGGNEIA